MSGDITPTQTLPHQGGGLILSLYAAYRPPYLPRLADSGAHGQNMTWERGEAAGWRIGIQRHGGDFVEAGVAAGNDDLRATGWRILDWGLRHQSRGGGFPGSEGLPLYTHSYFTESLARAVLADPRADRRDPLRRAATWMMLHFTPDNEAALAPQGHAAWMRAAALAQAFAVLDDAGLRAAAEACAAIGRAALRDDGTAPENGGFDARYQSLSLLFAARAAALLPGLEDAVARLGARLLPVIGEDGAVDLADSTRTGQEADCQGRPRALDYPRLLHALVLAGAVTGDAAYGEAARRVLPHAVAAVAAV